MEKELKNYKQTSIGLIPCEWEVLKLKNIAKITSGSTPLRSNSSFHKEGTINWVKTTDLNNGKITKTEERITEIALSQTSLRIYPKKTILVAMYGGFNQIGRTGILEIEATINQALSALTVDSKKVCSKFLLYWLNANVSLWKKFAGSSRKDPNISSKDVGDFPFIIMPIEEQEKIASIITEWDTAIDNCKGIIKNLKIRNKGLSQQLLSGKMRLAGFEDDFKDKFELLGNFINEVSLKNKDLSLKRVLSVTNSKGFINQNEQFEREVASKDLSNYKIIKKGQFAYNPSRINVGSVDLLKTFEVGILSPMYVVFESNEQKLLPDFLNHHLKTYWFKGHIPMFVQGSVRDSLSFDGLCGMKFFIPSIEEQKAITKILDDAKTELNKYQQKLKVLQLQKKGLMQQLLTGKVRVK